MCQTHPWLCWGNQFLPSAWSSWPETRTSWFSVSQTRKLLSCHVNSFKTWLDWKLLSKCSRGLFNEFYIMKKWTPFLGWKSNSCTFPALVSVDVNHLDHVFHDCSWIWGIHLINLLAEQRQSNHLIFENHSSSHYLMKVSISKNRTVSLYQ